MIMSRVIALLMVSAAGAAQAQQSPPAAAQPASPTASKADSGDKVTCRIHMDENIPRRVCMTNAQWKKFDSQNGSSGQSYNNEYHCNTGPAGAC